MRIFSKKKKTKKNIISNKYDQLHFIFVKKITFLVIDFLHFAF